MKDKFLKLKGRMTEMGYTRPEFAKAMGLNYQSLNRRLNGTTDFTLTELVTISKLLNITDPALYFFEQ